MPVHWICSPVSRMWGITRETRHLFQADVGGWLPSLEEQGLSFPWAGGSTSVPREVISKEVLWKSRKWLDTLHRKSPSKRPNQEWSTPGARQPPFKFNPQGKCLTFLQKDLQLHLGQLHVAAAELLRNHGQTHAEELQTAPPDVLTGQCLPPLQCPGQGSRWQKERLRFIQERLVGLAASLHSTLWIQTGKTDSGYKVSASIYASKSFSGAVKCDRLSLA